MYLKRRIGFSAGCLEPAAKRGGHNYVCELTVGGTIDPDTGMVVNIRDIDAVLKAKVLEALNGKILDQDVPALGNAPVTVENIAQWIWEQCKPALPDECILDRVTLWETPGYWAKLAAGAIDGEATMLTVTRAYDFSASHRLHANTLSDAENTEIFGKCNWANGHGHNYEVEVTLAGERDLQTGELCPPAEMDRIVDEEVLKPYDHKHLNFDAPEFAEINPTSENLTLAIWEKLAPRFEEIGQGRMLLYKVGVRETKRNYFEYYGGARE